MDTVKIFITVICVFWTLFSAYGWYNTVVLIMKTPAEKINKIQFKTWSIAADFAAVAWFIAICASAFIK